MLSTDYPHYECNLTLMDTLFYLDEARYVGQRFLFHCAAMRIYNEHMKQKTNRDNYVVHFYLRKGDPILTLLYITLKTVHISAYAYFIMCCKSFAERLLLINDVNLPKCLQHFFFLLSSAIQCTASLKCITLAFYNIL